MIRQSPPEESIRVASLQEELESRYLAYALSTIISRSLPDVRDGLKPVHRRILYAMRALRLEPKAPYKKSARVVGDVIGKFHPHGDQAAYDAMVRLAQDFAQRYPMVDGQGNFGNIDGDGAAAMRYTEARLTAVAWAMMEDLDKDTVDLAPTYDGSLQEPMVLPGRFPNLLANGSTGIAVGMSTAIPPHNVGEILTACLKLIRNRETPVIKLMSVMPGPDFPTGGILMADEAELREVYETGRGSLRLRARWEKEELGRGMYRIVITEIPYQVPKSRLVERIAQLIVTKKAPFISDVRDESDENLRVVVEPKSGRVDPGMVMAFLFKNSDLESRVTVNLNVITPSTRPEVMDLRQILLAWLDHRFEVHTRRSRFELEKIAQRLHLLGAYLIVHLNIDEVIAIIKEHDEPAPVLMERFHLDEIQAEAILNMRLRNLRKLEEMSIRKEIEEKEGRAAELRAMLEDDGLMWKAVQEEVKRTRKEFADSRRTDIEGAVQEVEIKPEDLVQREALTLIVSRMGWVKTVKGHDIDLAKVRFKEADGLMFVLKGWSNEPVSFVSASGKVFTTLAHNLPSGKGFGEPISVTFEINRGDPVVWAMTVKPEREYFAASLLGQGFRIKGENLLSNQRKGRQVINYKKGDAFLHLLPVKGEKVASINGGRRLLICDLEEYPVLARGQGVRIQRLRGGEKMVDVITFKEEEGFTVDSGKRQRLINELAPWVGKRAARGSMLPHGFMGGAVFVGTGVPVQSAAKGNTGDLFQSLPEEELQDEPPQEPEE